ncbi:acyl-CoA dehydrogenase [Actinoplanes lobatus]|uniref:Acyl-CoA dehydrogenase n=1 Tax=Actinoplanes lobatus TaxID=113568 RepID=A0A7W7HKW1_9ACTN|nr:acyl-CoA dehydrogenase family protein [Actinoplanes lobatus]MBB4752413.1 alkylation response protein AidB-like acyl-CoA dehydrogenase [Actinoplanes lobatus]GGN95111.1 acyl-CoA dehydrogenase [Actinoplanes lobatus]GIE46123.1 acyl-CoA dehydrogenase [Actinoplanes lobatus]
MTSFVSRVRDYADQVLRPDALRTERDGVTAARISALRELRLLEQLGLSRDDDRLIHEIISAACFNTWLVWAQHAALTGRLADADRAGQPLPALARKAVTGEILIGAGISDVRGYPHRYISATRADGGWILSGTISWVSGWGLSEALTVAGVDSGTATVVTGLVEVSERTRRAEPLRLAVLDGSRTERVHLDDAFVPDELVISRKSLEQTRLDDLAVASDARGHHFGLAEAVLRELTGHPDPLAQDVATHWRPRIDRIRETAYRLADEAADHGGGAYRLEERLATKVASGEALATLTRALVVARSGRGLTGDDTAQLHARSALFILVQGQSAQVRRAQLTHLAGAGTAGLTEPDAPIA